MVTVHPQLVGLRSIECMYAQVSVDVDVDVNVRVCACVRVPMCASVFICVEGGEGSDVDIHTYPVCPGAAR